MGGGDIGTYMVTDFHSTKVNFLSGIFPPPNPLGEGDRGTLIDFCYLLFKSFIQFLVFLPLTPSKRGT